MTLRCSCHLVSTTNFHYNRWVASGRLSSAHPVIWNACAEAIRREFHSANNCVVQGIRRRKRKSKMSYKKECENSKLAGLLAQYGYLDTRRCSRISYRTVIKVTLPTFSPLPKCQIRRRLLCLLNLLTKTPASNSLHHSVTK